MGILLFTALLGIFAPWVAPNDPYANDILNKFAGPSLAYPLGTDHLGRCVFSRMLFGIRPTLFLSLLTMLGTIGIGVVMGITAGYFRGAVDEVIMRVVDVMLSFPSQIIILAVVAFLEPSLTNIMVVIGLTSWMGIARLVRAETLSLRERDFVSAARLSGVSTKNILLRHILPNALAPVTITAILGIGGAILTESGLSFLGLGVQPPQASWGNMLMEGKAVIEDAPWLSLFPGLAILLTVLGYNLLGESLRDMLDPRLGR